MKIMEIKINSYKEKQLEIYKPDRTLLGFINHHIELLDLRLQIFSEKIEGYYILYNDKEVKIKTDGTLDGDLEGYTETLTHTLELRNAQLNLDGSYNNYEYKNLYNKK